MKTLVRSVVVTMLVGAALAASSSWPASAAHDSPALTGWPCNPGLDPACAGANGAFHEEMPDLAIPSPAVPCVWFGNIIYGVVNPNGPQHLVATPLTTNPGHDHYGLLGTQMVCTDIGDVPTADAGNDGHMVDLLDPTLPLGGPNVDILELDPIDDQVPGEVDHTILGGNPDGNDHDFNDHHGRIDESAWSNSDGYAPGRDDADGVIGESNACGPTAGFDQNRGDIALGFDGSTGWHKYIRIGAVMYIWGCFDAPGGAAITANPFFGVTIVVPPAGGPFFGVGVRGPGWAFDGVTFNNS